MKRAANAAPVRDGFARRLLGWYDRHGRKDLPWKTPHDVYRIWVSEIMLQQTQVATVLPYFLRFIERFPDVRTLSRARLDSVLQHWSGLGYYARARNLHRAAREIVARHAGRFPRDLEAAMALPGIGRSTAGAILAQAFDVRLPILDGNVKRVLARYHAIAAPLDERAVHERLWALAEQHTPRARVGDYTQAIMDLGATVCRRTRPQCGDCPVRSGCVGAANGLTTKLPVRAIKPPRPLRRTRLLMVVDARGRVLLERRPARGIWGGLWSLPQTSARDVRTHARDRLGLEITPQPAWPRLRHAFTHFELEITPVPARLVGRTAELLEKRNSLWYNLRSAPARGVAAPVAKLLKQLGEAKWHEW